MSKLIGVELCAVALAAFTGMANAAAISGSGNGGDEYTLDFVKCVSQEIYPWLRKNGSTLKPKVSADDFLLALDPKTISSTDHVFESCDGSNSGREVEACHNPKSGLTYLSRTRYPIHAENSPAKWRIVAHEIFGLAPRLVEIVSRVAGLRFHAVAC